MIEAHRRTDAETLNAHPAPGVFAASKNRRRHLVNVGLISLAVIALFWRVIFLGETFVDVSTLNNQLPWGYYAGQSSDSQYNRRDLTDTYVTRDYFVVDAYGDGERPLWNPYSLAGHPIYADGVTRTLSPFLLFYAFFDVPLGYSFARIAELLLAAIFIYIFLAAIGATPNGALMGALAHTFAAHSMLHLTGLGWWGGLMWLPLILLCVDRAITRNSFAQAIFAGVFLALQFFCGWMQSQIYYVGLIGLYYLFFALKPGRESEKKIARPAMRDILRSVAMMAVTFGVGFALAATQWMPVMELLENSNRQIVPTEIGYIYLPPWYAATLVFPNLFGAAYDAEMIRLFTALGVSHDHSLYLGIASLLPLSLGIRRALKTRKRKQAATTELESVELEPEKIRAEKTGPQKIKPQKIKPQKVEAKKIAPGKIKPESKAQRPPTSGPRPLFDAPPQSAIRNPQSAIDRPLFFLLIAAFALFIMMAAPVYVHLTRFIPVLQTIRVIVRAGPLFVFAASALIAFGVDSLLKSGADSFKRYALFARRFFYAALAFVLIAAAASYLMKLSGFFAETAGKGKLAFLRRSAAALSKQFLTADASLLLPLLFLAGVALLLSLTASGKISRSAFYSALVMLLVIDLFWNSNQYNPTFNRARIFPPTQITDLLKSLPPGRVLIIPSDLDTNRQVLANPDREKIIAPPNTLLPYRISTVSGKDQLFPRSYRDFASLIEPQHLSHIVFDETRSRYYDLLNARYVLTHASRPALTGYDLLATAEGVSVYENRRAMPRAFFAGSIIEVSNRADALRALADPGFDPQSAVVLETEGKFAGAEQSSTEASKELRAQATSYAARIIEDRRNRVVIETETPNDAPLVLSDNYYPGWRAHIDSAPAEILRANSTMRAVRVPAGRHMVSFEFAPGVLKKANYLSLASTAAALVALVVIGLSRRRQTRGKE